MKIVNTYKQGSITWFGYTHLFGMTKRLNTFTDFMEAELSGWLDNMELKITKRTKDTV